MDWYLGAEGKLVPPRARCKLPVELAAAAGQIQKLNSVAVKENTSATLMTSL